MADATSARLDAYKANRLIPQEIKLPTPETTESDSQEVVVFTSNALSWSAESAGAVKYADYMGLSTPLLCGRSPLHAHNIIFLAFPFNKSII